MVSLYSEFLVEVEAQSGRCFVAPLDSKDSHLEAAPIGWQLFVLESGKSDSIVFLLLLATYATRLLAQALRTAEDLLELLVDDLGVVYGKPALEILAPELLEPPVGLGVHPADEEARHAGNLRRIASAFHESFEAPDVGFCHGAIALEREDQGDVDRDPGRYGVFDRPQALLCGRDLDQQVRAVDHLPQKLRACDGPLRVEGQLRGDLQRHISILVLCLLVNGHEDVASIPDIAHRDMAEDLPRIIRLFGELLELLVVELALGDGLLEDGGVRGHAQHPIFRHPL